MTDIQIIAAGGMPPGEYAIVEILGHRALVGRVSEIERFGTKMLQVEPLFASVMLAPVLQRLRARGLMVVAAPVQP
jgi:hypothetical protein